MAKLEAPKNPLVQLLGLVMDLAMRGIPVGIIRAHAIASFPFLGLPVVNSFFRWGLSIFVGELQTNLKLCAQDIVIRFQNNQINADYKDAIVELKEKTEAAVGKEEHEKVLADAKAKMDRLINRNRV